MAEQTYDFVVYGATSFVGQLLARYLFERHGANGELRWALAARSRAKLEQVRSQLGADDLPLIIADANDEAALTAMCEQAEVVVSTVGPYMLYGSTLVEVCAATGTDYCDLTGEVPWAREMMDTHAGQAARTGARIVSFCGFDSIPSDLGVWFLQREARQRFGAPAQRVRMRVKGARGTLSGGTFASLINVAKRAGEDAAVRRLLTDCYALLADKQRPTVKQPKVPAVAYVPELDRWAAPFVMGMVNMPVVHRSNALLDAAYGGDFQYDEAMLTGRGMRGRAAAWALASGLGLFMGAASLALTRRVLQRFVLPAPGQGPSPEAQANGFFDIRFLGETESGEQLHVKVTGDRDPGYGATAKMLGEAVVTLAKDTPRDALPGGFWTPASAFGGRLVDRLTAHAGLTFEVLE